MRLSVILLSTVVAIFTTGLSMLCYWFTLAAGYWGWVFLAVAAFVVSFVKRYRSK